MAKKNKRNIVPNVSKETRDAIAAMPPELKKVYEAMLHETHELDRGNITGRLRIGKMVDEVMTRRAKNGEEKYYGEGAVELLATALSLAPADLYRFRSVRVHFDDEQINRLLTRTAANGHVISFSHLAVLATIDRSSLREQLTEKVFRDSLSVRDLQAAVQAKLARHGNNPNGRPVSSPRSATAALMSLEKVSTQFARVQDGLNTTVFERLQRGDVDADADLLQHVSKALDCVDRTVGQASEVRRKLTAAKQKLAQMVAAGERKEKTDKLTRQAKLLKIQGKAGKKLKLKLRKGKKGRSGSNKNGKKTASEPAAAV